MLALFSNSPTRPVTNKTTFLMMSLDPAGSLDVLGNENLRRILNILSFRPFYLNEIAKQLDVGVWTVIDHLEMEGSIEERIGDIGGDFQGGSIDVMTMEDVAGWKKKVAKIIKG